MDRHPFRDSHSPAGAFRASIFPAADSIANRERSRASESRRRRTESARDLNPPAVEPTAEEAAALPSDESQQSTPPPVIPLPTPLPKPEPLSTAQSTATVSSTATPKLKPSPGPQPEAKHNKSRLTEKQTAPAGSAAEKVASKSPQKTQSANARSGTVSGGGRGDMAPSYRSNPQPEYPEEARQLEQQGVVMLDVLVSADGRAAEVVVKRSSDIALSIKQRLPLFAIGHFNRAGRQAFPSRAVWTFRCDSGWIGDGFTRK